MFFHGEFFILSTNRSGWDVIRIDQTYRENDFRNALITSLPICNDEYICIASKDQSFSTRVAREIPSGCDVIWRGGRCALHKGLSLCLFAVVSSSLNSSGMAFKLFSKTFSLFFYQRRFHRHVLVLLAGGSCVSDGLAGLFARPFKMNKQTADNSSNIYLC